MNRDFERRQRCKPAGWPRVWASRSAEADRGSRFVRSVAAAANLAVLRAARNRARRHSLPR